MMYPAFSAELVKGGTKEVSSFFSKVLFFLLNSLCDFSRLELGIQSLTKAYESHSNLSMKPIAFLH